jgi:hypothetical protein
MTKEHRTYNKTKKDFWIGHFLCRNCLLKHITEVMLRRTRRRGRKRKHKLRKLDFERGRITSHSDTLTLEKPTDL